MQRVQESSGEGPGGADDTAQTARRPRGAGMRLAQLAPWLIALICFAFLYRRISGAAGREGLSAGSYLLQIFSQVSWPRWLAVMLPYSFLFLLIDSAVLWRVVSWFNAPVRYLDIVPIRASTYILSILDERVGKGAIALYLHRRDGIPGWEVGSSMLFIMFCEFYYLLSWATLGYALHGASLPTQFSVIPWLAAGALLVFAAFHRLFRAKQVLPAALLLGAGAAYLVLRCVQQGIGSAGSGELGLGGLAVGLGELLGAAALAGAGLYVFRRGETLVERPILRAFRRARLTQYLGVIALRSPAMLGAVVVYTIALRLFGIQEEFGTMLGYLPVIFFGATVPGPMRAVAIAVWVALYPEDKAGAMAAFGFVQHNFFVFFNAALGLLFLRRANRELFGSA